MSKMGSHGPFEYLKHKLWPKERPIIKWPIWLPTTKSQELPQFPCVRVACYMPLECSQQRLQDLTSIRGLHTKLCTSKVVRVPILGISGLSFESPKQNDIWVLAPWPGIKNTIKGKGGGFPQVRVVVSLMNPCLLVACPCTKSVPSMH
jgi:hypothetical protein